jgi:PAS domain S-box-containing protein
MNEILSEHRCPCGKMLFRGLILTGNVEIKCRFCKALRTIPGLSGDLSSPHQYLLILDMNGKILKTTESAPAILGYSSDELLEMYAHNLIVMLHPHCYTSLQEMLDERGLTVILFQSLHRHKDKSMSPVHIEARTFSSSEGRHLLFIVERKRGRNGQISVEEIARGSMGA